ncbi:MAG TPA: hypothetical protein VGN12_27555 [Pirellulales bacterium]|jgi:hypothetical protein
MVDVLRKMIEITAIVVVIAVVCRLIADFDRGRRRLFLAPLLCTLVSVVLLGGWGSSWLARKQGWADSVVLLSPLVGLVAYGVLVRLAHWLGRISTKDTDA